MAPVPQIGWFCSFVAATLAASVMGQPPSPSNWFWETPPSWDGTPPQPEVPSYANGQLSPVNYNKRNHIFICDDEWGKTCVAQCPDLCPTSCEMSCSYCETSCRCVNFPGTSWGDPSFTGGDGITFYFHGRKDQDFCIVSDADLHINAHFIGNHNPVNERTFTWIQSLGVSFDDHRLFVGARKAIEWDEEEDHIEITF